VSRTAPLVLIEWEDSAQPVPGWSWLDDQPWESIVVCRSVGWLIHDGETTKALAPNAGQMCGDWQVSGVIRIPTRCVTRMVRLSRSEEQPVEGPNGAPTFAETPP
jgi:hypothetical protein